MEDSILSYFLLISGKEKQIYNTDRPAQSLCTRVLSGYIKSRDTVKKPQM